MLANLTIAITVRFVEPVVEEVLFLPVRTVRRPCLRLDIHRCKGIQKSHCRKKSVYHTNGGFAPFLDFIRVF